MAFLEKVLKKSDALDMEEFLNNLDKEDETMYEDADAFVKPFTLAADADADIVLNEARGGNIVLLNIGDLGKRNAIKLKEMVSKIREGVYSMNGDIARISQDRVLITPSRVKIVKKKGIQ